MTAPDELDGQRRDAMALARRRAVAIIDLAALRANYTKLAVVSAPAHGAPVVKGNGYGLGMVRVAATAASAGARQFLIARREDGEVLREALPEAEILVLDGLGAHDVADFERCALTPVLGDLGDLKRWFAAPRRIPAFVHFDTGMSRLGLRPCDAGHAAAILQSAPDGSVAGYLTHFLNADEADVERCARQVADFRTAIGSLPKARTSIVNSAGLFLDEARAWRGSFTRLGKALYGIPSGPAAAPNQLQPVLSVFAPLLQVRDVAAGETVGYGATFTATAPLRIAALGIGYTNGYLRSLSNRGAVYFGPHRAALAGRVSMDLLTADVTHVPDAALAGGIAEIIGPHMTLTELSALARSNEHEMQISLGNGCHRIYLGA